MYPHLPQTGWELFLLGAVALFVTRYMPERIPAEKSGARQLHGFIGLPIKDVPRLAMQILLSFALGGASLWMILSQRYDPGDRRWAFGTLGTIVGFWLHSK